MIKSDSGSLANISERDHVGLKWTHNWRDNDTMAPPNDPSCPVPLQSLALGLFSLSCGVDALPAGTKVRCISSRHATRGPHNAEHGVVRNDTSVSFPYLHIDPTATCPRSLFLEFVFRAHVTTDKRGGHAKPSSRLSLQMMCQSRVGPCNVHFDSAHMIPSLFPYQFS